MCGLLVLAGYLLMVNKRRGHMVGLPPIPEGILLAALSSTMTI